MGPVSRWMRKLLQPLVRRDLSEESWAAMGMNLAANLLGLGNAATPFGIRAAQLLAGQGADGLRGLLVLLVINNSGLELMPSAVMTLRQQAGRRHDGGDLRCPPWPPRAYRRWWRWCFCTGRTGGKNVDGWLGPWCWARWAHWRCWGCGKEPGDTTRFCVERGTACAPDWKFSRHWRR